MLFLASIGFQLTLIEALGQAVRSPAGAYLWFTGGTLGVGRVTENLWFGGTPRHDHMVGTPSGRLSHDQATLTSTADFAIVTSTKQTHILITPPRLYRRIFTAMRTDGQQAFTEIILQHLLCELLYRDD